jgi:ABC-type sugar transport system ATPase subunit
MELKTDAIIEFKNVSKSFGAIKALTDVSFSIKRGVCHAIVGENGAGKSTLMNILSGVYVPDSGQVIYNGKRVKITSPSVSSELGITTVFQELELCPNLTAADNIYLGRTPTTKFGIVKKGNIAAEAKKVLDMFGIDIDVNTPVKYMSIAQMQLIELGKGISKDAQVLILDEPTSSLTAMETDKLFDVLRRLKNEGKTIIFISHRLTEIFQLADTVSVLRDGKSLGFYPCCELDEDKVVKLIAGDKLYAEMVNADRKLVETCCTGKVAIEAVNLSRGKLVHDVNFELHEGEILGFYGLQGAGRTELVETLFGIHPADSGEIKVYGKRKVIKNPKQAINCGFAFITEDRKNKGIFAKMKIRDNVCVMHRKRITWGGFVLNNKKISKMSWKYCHDLSIKTADINQNILGLSGGNQQKVIIARMLSTEPNVILADEPTRGVDVGAKAEIFSILRSLKNMNKAIIVISSELKEVVKECDRILVMRNGRIVGEVKEPDGREEKILNFAFNG